MRFGLQLHTDTVTDAVVAATEAEEFGFDVVLVADHVGRDWSPLLTLATVAAATSRIRVGTFVLNACLHHPVMLAREIATLDQISGGRVELGLGAGHTPAEFAATGTPFASAAARKAQLAEFVEVIRRLLDGETVDHDGEQFVLRAASVRPPVQARVPILVGGSGAGLLGHAGRHADIVGLTGLGRTLPDGHRHAARFQPATVDADVAVVREAAVGRDVELNVLVQVVDVTDDRRVAAERLAAQIDDLSVDDALDTPFVLLGSHDEIAAQLEAVERRWGIGYVVVRDAATFAPVIDRLRA